MKHFYHGTSAESAAGILQHGFGSVDTVWTVSDYNYVYLHPEETEYDSGIVYAYDSAITAAAIQGSQKDYIVVIQITLADEDVDEYVTIDCTIEDAVDTYEINADDLNKLIKQGKVQIAAAKIPGYEPMYRSFYLCGCVNKFSNIPDDIRGTIMHIAKTCGDIACFKIDREPSIQNTFEELEPFTLAADDKQTSFFTNAL